MLTYHGHAVIEHKSCALAVEAFESLAVAQYMPEIDVEKSGGMHDCGEYSSGANVQD